MPRTVTIYRGLLTTFLAVVIMLSVAILAVTIFGVRHAIETLAVDLIRGTTNEAEEKLRRFFTPAQRGLAVARAWGEAGLLPIEQPDEINAALMPLLREFPQITSVLVADRRGRENMLLRLGDTWKNRRTRVDLWGAKSQWAEWDDDGVKSVEWRELGYDPRFRPWFEGAIQTEGEVHWTSPYIFFTTKDPGITASVSFEAADGVTRVVGFDLMLRDISAFTSSVSAGPLAKVFVMTDDDRIVGLPAHPRFQDDQAQKAALLSAPVELELPVVTDALLALAASDTPDVPVRFRGSDGSWWWGADRRFALGPERFLKLVVTVPEALLLREVRQIRLWVVGVTFAVIAFALWRSRVLARRFSRPIEALARESGRIAQGDLEQKETIETEFKEVRRLAQAHDHMRTALRTLLKLERDLQIARQIQQGTFPDSLPRVDGFQLAAWSEPADQTGGDTYDLVGVRHAETGDIILTGEQPERTVLLLADATGHGVGPALSVTQVRAMLRMAVRSGLGLEAILRYLNQQLCEDLSEGRFVTAWLAELSPTERSVRYFSAAQGPLLHYVAATRTVELLKPNSPPLGIIEQLDFVLPAPIVMQPGDLFACISDGIFEAHNARRELFDIARVVELIERNHMESADEILERLRQAVDAFVAGTSAEDDLTAVLIKCL